MSSDQYKEWFLSTYKKLPDNPIKLREADREVAELKDDLIFAERQVRRLRNIQIRYDTGLRAWLALESKGVPQ